jgi:hypothetical protein
MGIASLAPVVLGPKEARDHHKVWDRLEAWGGSLVFLALDPFMALPMAGLLPPSQALVVAWDDGCAVKQLEAAGIEVIVVGRELTTTRSTHNLLESGAVRAALTQRAGRGNVGVLAFKPNARLKKAIQDLGFDKQRVRLLAPPVGVARAFENKLRFPELIAQYKIPVPPYKVFKPVTGPSYEELKAQFGSPFVAQSASGFSGAGTHLVQSEEDWGLAVGPRPEKSIKVSAFLLGKSLTLNGCILGPDKAPVIGEVMEQLTGWSDLTPYKLGSCGNVWGAPDCPAAVRGEATALARKVGAALSEAGYIGHFGVDIVAEESGRIAVIECNPRFTATLPVDTVVSRLRREASLFALHVLSGLDLECEDLGERRPGPAMTQLIYRHRGAPVCLPARYWRRFQPGPAKERLCQTSFLREHWLVPGAAFFLPAAGGRRVEEGMESARLILAGEVDEERKSWALAFLKRSGGPSFGAAG